MEEVREIQRGLRDSHSRRGGGRTEEGGRVQLARASCVEEEEELVNESPEGRMENDIGSNWITTMRWKKE